MPVTLAPATAARAIQQPHRPHPFSSFQVSSAQLLRDESFRPTWVYEVKGTLAGRPVRLVTDANKLGDLRLEDRGTTRTLTRCELLDLRGALQAYSKAQYFNPPQGVHEAVYAINEALSGPAPMKRFQPTGVRTWEGGGWDQGISIDGRFPGSRDSVNIVFRSSSATGSSDLSLLWQHGAPSTRARPMVRSELEATIRALTPKATGQDAQARLYGVVLSAAKKALAALPASSKQ